MAEMPPYPLFLNAQDKTQSGIDGTKAKEASL